MPSMDADSIITALGGTSRVADLCGARLGKRVLRSSVSNWRKNGIPVLYRPAIKAIAADCGVVVPIDFVPGEVPVNGGTA